MKALLTIFILAIVGVSIFLVVQNNQKVVIANKELDTERYERMVAQEGFDKAKQKVSSLESESLKNKKKVESLNQLVDQLKSVNGDLKGRLDKASELKKTLESQVEELKSAAASTGL